MTHLILNENEGEVEGEEGKIRKKKNEKEVRKNKENWPWCCFSRWHFKRNLDVKEKASINIDQWQTNMVVNKDQTNVLGAPSIDAEQG